MPRKNQPKTQPQKTKAQEELQFPNRRTIEQFFRELGNRIWVHSAPVVKNQDNIVAAVKKQLLNRPLFKRVCRNRDKVYASTKILTDKIEKRIEHVRSMYFTRGMTPEVLREVSKLADEVAAYHAKVQVANPTPEVEDDYD